VTNPLAPKIVHAVNNGDKEGIRLACRKMFKEVGIWCVVLAVVMVGVLPWVLQYLNNSKLDQHQLVFAIMLLATLLRTVSEAADNVLYAHHQDRKIALVSIAAMFVSGLLILLLAPWFELPGVAVAMFGAALFVFSWRGLIARKLIAR
jgi:O-antigen/teichoic acid export membrane protein